jgi:hypothetical protein
MLFDADAYTVDLDARMQGIRFAQRKYNKKNELEDVLNEIYSNLKLITLQGQIKGTEQGTTTKLSSNLDRYFNQQIRNIAKRKVEETKAKVRKELDARVNQARREIEKEIATRRQELEGLVEAKRQELEREIDKVRAEIEKKQQMVEDRINEEKKKAEEAARKEAEKATKKLGDEIKKLW